MDIFRKVWYCSRFSWQRERGSIKNKMILCFLFVYLWGMTIPLRDFAEHVGYGITAWIFPFQTSDVKCQLTIMVCAICFFCDLGKRNADDLYVIGRSGSVSLVLGQFFYLVGSSFVISIMLYGMSVVVVFPRFESSMQWGKVIGTLCYTNQAGLNWFQTEIFASYSPIAATMWSILLEWVAISSIAGISYMGNLLSSSYIGSLSAVVIILLDFMVENILPYSVYRFSPASLARLCVLKDIPLYGYPSMLDAFQFFGFVLLASLIVSCVYKRKRKNGYG